MIIDSIVDGSKGMVDKEGNINKIFVLIKEEEEELVQQRCEECKRKDKEFMN